MIRGHFLFVILDKKIIIIEEPLHILDRPIEEYTMEHRASLRKMVWFKILMSVGLSILGWVLPLIVKIHYIPYLGNSLKFTSLLLMIQGFRTLRAYAKVNKEVVPKTTYGRSDITALQHVLESQIAQNTIEQKLSLAGLIIAVIVSVIIVLSQEYVLIAASFIPIALILAIEFCFTLVLLHVQNLYKRKLDRVEV